MSMYVEKIPLVTRKSSRSGTLFSSVGQYVGVPVDRNEQFFSWLTFYNSLPFVVVKREPHTVCVMSSPQAINFGPSV
jgi:hypothetical protein